MMTDYVKPRRKVVGDAWRLRTQVDPGVCTWAYHCVFLRKNVVPFRFVANAVFNGLKDEFGEDGYGMMHYA